MLRRGRIQVGRERSTAGGDRSAGAGTGSAPPSEAPRGEPPRLARLFRISMDTPDMVFSARLRRAGSIWVAATLPFVTLSGLFVHGESAYLVVWVLTSGLYTTPALVITFLAIHGVQRDDRRFWQLWFAGQVLVYTIGLSVLVTVLSGFVWLRPGGGIGVVVATTVFGVALVMMMRSRSGGRALSLDVVDQAILLVGIVALAPLLAEPIFSSPAAWFVAPAALVMVALIISVSWALTLIVRVDRAQCTVERLGIALAFVAAVDAATQVAQGLSGFTLPSSPLFFIQGLCMALVLLTPLHLRRQPPAGLDRLPPHAQVRGGLAPLPLAVVPLLALATMSVRNEVPWALTSFACVLVVLLVLSTLRHLLVLRETKRLYAQVETAAEERRLLLAEVMQSADQDRHRVAAQLHEQATSSYVAFLSYLQATGDPHDADEGSPLTAVRDDLARQADSLRRLMLAVKPLEVARPGPQRLTAPIGAYIDSLYGDHPTPVVHISIDEDLALDWTTETIVFRIVQEALRNVRAHAEARRIDVRVVCAGSALEVHVDDDGIGFDPDATLFESGIATMRQFAAFNDGAVHITSRRGHGTAVVARLGPEPDAATGSRPVPSERPAAPRVTAAGRRRAHEGHPVIDLRVIEGGAGAGERDVVHT